MKFGRTFPLIMQSIWEAVLVQVPVLTKNMDGVDAYLWVTLRPSQVGAFSYIILLVDKDEYLILCLDLVLLFLWVDPPKLFLALLYIMTDVANELVGALLL